MFFPVIIQARMGSKRLPGKVLFKHNNIEMLKLMILRLKKLKKLKPIIVATSKNKKDKNIVKFCKSNNIAYFKGSEKNVLSRYYLAAKKFKLNKIIRLTSDCPLIDIKIIDKLIRVYNKKKYDFVSNSVPPPSSFPDGSDVEIFSFQALERAFRNSKLSSEKEHVTFYIWKSGFFKTFKLKNKNNFSKIRYSLDYKNDYKLITNIIDFFGKKIFTCNTNQIVRFIKKNPKLVEYQKKIGRYDGWKPALKKDKIQNYE